MSKGPSEREVRDVLKAANERYARLSVVTNILKGPGRERYDYFLKNGFPKWRGTGYYYARFRPGLGSVLAGLFIFGGGLVHYGAMYLSWRRQQEFVNRYIRHARKAAWGDESAIRAIPGLDALESSATPSLAPENGGVALNRRQKRLQEKESKKEREKKSGRGMHGSGTSTPNEQDVAAPSQGPKKRVQAENGKMLIVDSLGKVFLEDEDEDGQIVEFLLDPEEIAKPTIQQTVMFRLPVWTFAKIKNRFVREAQDDEGEEQEEPAALEPNKPTANGAARTRTRRKGR